MEPTNWNSDYAAAPYDQNVRLLLNTGRMVMAVQHRSEYEGPNMSYRGGWESEEGGEIDDATILGWLPEHAVPPQHADAATSPIITATIDISAWNGGAVEKAIIAQAVDRLVARCQYDMTAVVRETVKQTIAAKADAAFGDFVAKHLLDLFTKGVAPAGFDGTDKAPVPIEETLLAQFNSYLNQKVNSAGETVNGYDRDGKYITRNQYLLNTLAHAPLQKAIEAAIKDIRAQAEEMIKASVSGYITEKLMPNVTAPALGAPPVMR